MIEEVDAALAANLWNGIWLCLGALFVGGMVDFVVFPWLRRRLGHRGWRVAGVLIRALRFQALTIAVILGTLEIINDSGAHPEIVNTAYRFAAFSITIVLAIFGMRILTGLVQMSLHQHHRATVSIVNLLIRVISILLIITLVLALLGVSVTPLLTIIAGSSLGLSLALKDPLANLFAGLQILAAGRLRPGSYVQLSTGQSGYVTDVRWSDTTIRELSNNIIIVPNVILTTTLLVNYDLPEPEQLLEVAVEVPYASDLPHVEKVTLDVARGVMQTVEGGVRDWLPFIRYTEFTATLVKFVVTLRVHGFVDQQLVRHEFLKQLQERYLEEQINDPAAKGEAQ